jgi:hypothetical protein
MTDHSEKQTLADELTDSLGRWGEGSAEDELPRDLNEELQDWRSNARDTPRLSAKLC